MNQLSNDEFSKLSKEKQKQYIAKLIIAQSNASPVEADKAPGAVIMAGLPGSGKTEFLDSFIDIMPEINKKAKFVRIDLDQVVTVFPGYTPQTYAKFRSKGNVVVARAIDAGRAGRYNLMIDGTFAGSSGASIRNIEKLIANGYQVSLYYMFDEPITAWGYTKDREKDTKRGIELEGFLRSCQNIPDNVRSAYSKFFGTSSFRLFVVEQKKLRDKEYVVHDEIKDVEKFIKVSYNIDKFRKLL